MTILARLVLLWVGGSVLWLAYAVIDAIVRDLLYRWADARCRTWDGCDRHPACRAVAAAQAAEVQR